MTSPLFRNTKQVFIYNARPGRGNGMTPLPGLTDFFKGRALAVIYTTPEAAVYFHAAYPAADTGILWRPCLFFCPVYRPAQ